MARMWPERLPRSVLEDWRRQAEVRVFRALRDRLGNRFEVFYSSPWLGTDRFGNEIDGECDFLVAHEQWGILAVEVKGGGISFDPEASQWWSKDRNGIRHRIKDPVGQARDAKYRILERLRQSRRWNARHIRAAHGVILPNSGTPAEDLGADRPREIFCPATRFRDDLPGWISERMGAGQALNGTEKLGGDGLAALRDILAKPFTLEFTLGSRIAEAVEELTYLQPEQYRVLDHTADLKRALLQGGAGTGKTMIAMEAARRSAERGARTLLTCFNRPLAIEMQRRLGGREGLMLDNFHRLCSVMAGGDVPLDRAADALSRKIAANPALKWDSIIVDEGQDFREDWWIALEEALAPGGSLLVMADTNQKLYHDRTLPERELELISIRLTRNLRNTQRVHAAAKVHYQGHAITADGPEGVEVEWVGGETGDELVDRAIEQLRRLAHADGVAPSDIAILLPNLDWVTRFDERNRTRIPVSSAEDLAGDSVVVDTIRRFKGLERPVVVVLLAADDTLVELAYVAFSRASAHLVVIAENGVMKTLRGNELVTGPCQAP